MVHGLYRVLKIVLSIFGTRELRLCNVCCWDIKIRVSFYFISFYFKLVFNGIDNVSPVIAIDLSLAGNILATGSGDFQARICTSPILLQSLLYN